MKIETWQQALKEAKLNQNLYTGHFDGIKTTRRVSCTEPDYFIIKRENRCNHCGHEHQDSIEVRFHEPIKRFTIFQRDILFMLFSMKKRPVDYASYHKCVAGQKFIGNIKSIIVESDSIRQVVE